MRAAADAWAVVAAGAVLALAGAGCRQAGYDEFITERAEDDQYQVVVATPDGRPAAGAEVRLDYEAGWDYARRGSARVRTGRCPSRTATPRTPPGSGCGSATRRAGGGTGTAASTGVRSSGPARSSSWRTNRSALQAGLCPGQGSMRPRLA